MVERNRAMLKPPASLDAWEAHHRGLWHMYRFNKTDNERARQFFAQAVELDPTFARAYAGLSFAHFQNAFLGWKKSAPEIDRAFEAAGKGLMVDDRDPAAHWAMGRALWLRGEPGPGHRRAGARRRPLAQLRHRPLHARVRARAVRRSEGRDFVLGSFAAAVAVRSPAVRHAGHARHEPGAARSIRRSRRMGHQGGGPPQCAPAHHGHRRVHAGARRADRRKPTTTRRGSASAFPTTRWRISWRRSACSPEAAALFTQGAKTRRDSETDDDSRQ